MDISVLKYMYSYNLSRVDHYSKFNEYDYDNKLVKVIWLTFCLLKLAHPFFWIMHLIFEKKIAIKNSVAFVFTNNQVKVASLFQRNINYTIIDWRTVSTRTKILLVTSLLLDRNYLSVLREIRTTDYLICNLKNVIKSYAFYNYVDRYMDLKELRTYIQFNDHSPLNFALESLFRANGVQTVYIQHAPVGEHFPPLYHSRNILFSKDSRTKYKIGPTCEQVEVMYDPRFFIQEKSINFELTQGILLCPNLLDDKIKVLSTYKELNDLGYEVCIRKHPADKSKWPIEYTYSPDGTSIWHDLATFNIVVSNESAIALEAIYNGNIFYKMAYWSDSLDSYGFIRNGLITKEVESIEDLICVVENRECFQNEAKLEFFIGDRNNHLEASKS